MSNDRFTYPSKVLLAWGESITGNIKITKWLMSNGYPELGIFHYALRNQAEPRKWLIDHKFPHLMALIMGAEGDQEAISWLYKNDMIVLAKMAETGDNNMGPYNWLLANDHRIFAVIAMKIRDVKFEIEDSNHDPHKFNPD